MIMNILVPKKVIEVANVAEFLRAVQNFEQRHIAQWFFRGHGDGDVYKLVPSLYRLDLEGSFATFDEVEQYMMEIFICESTPYLNVAPECGMGWGTLPQHHKLEWLALAQHHKLPTRLLDWSTNPLVALYFAVDESTEKEGDVWCLGFPSTNNCFAESTYLARRKDLKNTNVIYFPKHISPRFAAQCGCFTVHTSQQPLNEAEDNELLGFTRIRVEASAKKRILNELFSLGIHRGFIYPDLDGVAQRIKFEVTTKHYRHTVFPEETG